MYFETCRVHLHFLYNYEWKLIVKCIIYIQKSRLIEIEHVEFVTLREPLLTSARLHNLITWLRIETLKII